MSNDRIKEVQKDIDETKEIMEDNIDNMLKNIEKAEVVEEKTDNLRENAKQFQKNTDDLKKVMWWKNMKLWLAIIAIIVVIVVVIVVVCVVAIK